MAHLVLYDGVCGLCDRSVQFLLRRDVRDRFLFAPLQSPLAQRLLARHGHDSRDLAAICVLTDVGTARERYYTRSRAVLVALAALGEGWGLIGLLRVFPSALLDVVYRVIATRRYRVFGQLDACAVPSSRDRAKFPEDLPSPTPTGGTPHPGASGSA